MSVEEELHEHAEHAKDPFDKRVAVTMAIIAALLAIVSVLGHILSTEELLAQQKASDQWAYSQSKDIRRYDSEIARDMMKALKSPEADAVAEHYSGNAEKYKKDHDDIQDKATEYEKSATTRAIRLCGWKSAKCSWKSPSCLRPWRFYPTFAGLVSLHAGGAGWRGDRRHHAVRGVSFRLLTGE